jgi:ABC-type hemin transport system ATPase subunit
VGRVNRLWKAISEVLFGDIAASGTAVTVDARKRAQAIAPVVWLLGKTGAGKTAIVAALTGDPRVEVGQGFECVPQLAEWIC